MDNQLRRQYLEAMGITSWVLRRPDSAETEVVPAVVQSSVERQTEPAPTLVQQADTPPPWLTEAPPPDAAWQPADAGELQHEPAPDNSRAVVAELDWDELQEHVVACKSCELHKSRTQTVFGAGSQQADLLIIGEAPGADEDRQGEPFVGRAGKLLNAMLKAIGLERNQVYIANILKCRPPGNRDPHVEEALHCEPYLMRQIELIRPKVIMAVGRVAAQNLLKSTDAVGRMRGRVFRFGETEIPLVVSYHPAYLLRSPEQKAKTWQDLQQVLKLLRADS